MSFYLTQRNRRTLSLLSLATTQELILRSVSLRLTLKRYILPVITFPDIIGMEMESVTFRICYNLQIACRVRSWRPVSPKIKSAYYESNKYFAGVMVS